MAFDRVRRFLLAGSVALLLASCGGGGKVVSDFKPTRMVAFGDSLTYLGANDAGRYTINDGSTNLWVLQLASRYGLSLNPSAAGGTGYAQAHARVAASTDARGVASSGSVKQQIDSFLGSGTLSGSDRVVWGAGAGDLIAEGAKAVNGAQSEAAALDAVRQAARDLAAQVRRLVNAGAKHVTVFGTHNLGRTPWARSVSRTDFLERLSIEFNNELVATLNDLAEHVLFIDAQLQMNALTGSSAYNATAVSCTPTSASDALGIGAGQVDSSQCTGSTLAAGFDGSKYLFADPVYPTPLAHRALGNFAYDRLRLRW